MSALSNNLAFWLAIIAGLGVLYVLPITIGAIRHVEHFGIVVGLTFIPILWPAALIGAFMLPRRRSVIPRPLPYGTMPQFPRRG